jgi:hypothetical protein
VSWKDSQPTGSVVYAWTGNRVLGVWGLATGLGYRVVDLDPSGTTAPQFQTLWPNERADSESLRVAASNGILAIVDNLADQSTQRGTCRLALARLDGFVALQSPTRFSDPTEQASLANEASYCSIAPLADGFVLLWEQIAGSQDASANLLAQRIRPDGTPLGDRLTLREGLGTPTPLDDGCTDPVCHVVMRFDYQTLGLRGWATVGGKPRAVSENEAKSIAAAAIKANEEYAGDDVQIFGGPDAGLYYAYVSPGDFGAFALVSAQSGALVAGGGVIWAGHGQLWAPATWHDPSDLACGDLPATPREAFSSGDDCTGDPSMKHASIGDALDTALRTNLAASVAARGPFDVYTYLYTPTVGACDARIAEYLVVLSQQRP